MSKLEQLTHELCPNGVEWLPMGEESEKRREISVVRNDSLAQGATTVSTTSLTTLA